MLIGICLAPAGAVAILALATHLIPRYSISFEFNVIVLSGVLLGWAASPAMRAIRRANGSRPGNVALEEPSRAG